MIIRKYITSGSHPIEQAFLRLFSNFELSPIQKRVIVAGMNDKELSPFDIYAAMNTDDRNTYDREVTTLRKRNLLNQIRTNPQASVLSKKNGIDKQKIGRFKIVIPTK